MQNDEYEWFYPIRGENFIFVINGEIRSKITSVEHSWNRREEDTVSISEYFDVSNKPIEKSSILIGISKRDGAKDGMFVILINAPKERNILFDIYNKDIIKYSSSFFCKIMQPYTAIPDSVKKMSKQYFEHAIIRLKERLGEDHILLQNLDTRFIYTSKTYVWWLAKNYLKKELKK